MTDEDDMESIAHRFLSAAVKACFCPTTSCLLSLNCVKNIPLTCLLIFSSWQLDRKPSKCIVFEDDPRGVTAAHNCTMMAVSLIGAHPAYVALFSLGQSCSTRHICSVH